MRMAILLLALAVPRLVSSAPDPKAVLIGNLSWIDSRPAPKLFVANERLWFPVLLKLVDDPTVSPRVQRRALMALQYYDRPEATALFREIATDGDRDPKLRARAIRCLALRQGRAALETLTGLLLDPAPRVRKDTLRALASLGVPGRDPIRGHLARETEPWLRSLARTLLGPDVAPTPMAR